MLNVMNINYVVFIDSVDMYNNLIKYIYHCSYLKTYFYIGISLQIYVSSKSMYIIFTRVL